MPMGFYARESIHPYYTTEEYLHSDRYKSEMEYLYRVEKVLRSLTKYPRKLWYLVLATVGIKKKHN